MGQYFDEIPSTLIPWLEAQKIFWVATAPLAEDGHVNISPKGCFEKTLNVVLDEDSVEEASGKKPTSRAVWYEDLTGSGVETISHIRENGRITVMFNAFEGPPRIARLFGTGKVYEFGTPEYDALLPPERRQPGSRAVIWVDVHKVGTSCGYATPFFEYKAPRVKLHKFAMGREQVDYEFTVSQAESNESSWASIESPAPRASNGASEIPEKGLKNYWKTSNIKSQDGLPGLIFAYGSAGTLLGDWNTKGGVFGAIEDDESVRTEGEKRSGGGGASGGTRGFLAVLDTSGVVNIAFGFGVGVLAGVALVRWTSR